MHLWAQRLRAGRSSPDRHSRVALLSNTQAWQGNLVEAPEMAVHDGHYMLFYSANNYASAKYASVTPAAPARSARAPIAATSRWWPPTTMLPARALLSAPGSPGHWELFFHAWPPDAIGSQSPGRQLWLEPLTWQGETPSVPAPDADRQPAPLA